MALGARSMAVEAQRHRPATLQQHGTTRTRADRTSHNQRRELRCARDLTNSATVSMFVEGLHSVDSRSTPRLSREPTLPSAPTPPFRTTRSRHQPRGSK
jgi:hypothetical protein